MRNKTNDSGLDICDECLYIGEGDFVCTKTAPYAGVVIDWMPTKEYRHCLDCDGRNKCDKD